MADTCTCPVNSNIACSGSLGINIYQPTCQIIPSGDRVNNPHYDDGANITYFSYGLSTHCGDFPPVGSPGLVEDFFVPVCENIPLSAVLSVDQVLDACPAFSSVNYDFNNTGGQTPPPGFQFLRIEVDESFEEGGSGIYRVALAGNYPAEETDANVKFTVVTTTRLGNFGAGQSFTFAGCPAIPRVTVIKNCETIISNNEATISYVVNVDNTGDTVLTDVMFSDMVNYDGTNVIIGPVTVVPDTINVDTSTSGLIVLTGELGDIPIGGSVDITYSFPVLAYTEPNEYVFTNMAMARSNETEGSSECMTTVEVVAFTTNNCCDVTDDTVRFIESLSSVGSSPTSAVTITSILSIPSSITIQLLFIGNCTATFVDTGLPAPLDVDISGRDIEIVCEAVVTTGSTMNYPIDIRIISINDFGSADLDVTFTIDDVSFQEPDEQILLSVTPLPNVETLEITSTLICEDI